VINDFSKFYTFMEIVKERSFSKASRALGISQPAVTLQIKKLEEMLQTTLIMRKKNGIVFYINPNIRTAAAFRKRFHIPNGTQFFAQSFVNHTLYTVLG